MVNPTTPGAWDLGCDSLWRAAGECRLRPTHRLSATEISEGCWVVGPQPNGCLFHPDCESYIKSPGLDKHMLLASGKCGWLWSLEMRKSSINRVHVGRGSVSFPAGDNTMKLGVSHLYLHKASNLHLWEEFDSLDHCKLSKWCFDFAIPGLKREKKWRMNLLNL
jgi:hypothetical protein